MAGTPKPANGNWTAMALGSSHRRSNVPNEFVNLGGILNALADFDSPAYVYSERLDLRHRLANVIGRQTTRQDERLGQISGDQRPVEHLTRPAWHTRNEGIEQNGAGSDVARRLRANVISRLDPQRLVPRPMKALAVGRLFITMELQCIQGYGVEDFVELTARGVDEQTDRRDERRQGGDDGSGLLNTDRARAFGVEHQANRISSRLGSDKCVLDPSDPTNLATNDRQWQAPATEDLGW